MVWSCPKINDCSPLHSRQQSHANIKSLCAHIVATYLLIYLQLSCQNTCIWWLHIAPWVSGSDNHYVISGVSPTMCMYVHVFSFLMITMRRVFSTTYRHIPMSVWHTYVRMGHDVHVLWSKFHDKCCQGSFAGKIHVHTCRYRHAFFNVISLIANQHCPQAQVNAAAVESPLHRRRTAIGPLSHRRRIASLRGRSRIQPHSNEGFDF